jgi:hypothetical protein
MSMPYKVVEENGKYCVYKHDADGNPTGKSHGCHGTREEANGQMRALYAAESKELDEAGEVLSLVDRIKALFAKERPMKTVGGEKYPASDFLVAEGDNVSDWHLQVKRHGTPDHNLMSAARAALASPGGHRGNRYEGPNQQEALAKLKRLYEAEGMDWDDKKENSFFVWKETTGYRWLAVYSSKFRDDDRPPEILSESAHREFVGAVDRGEWPMPELWLWHVKGTVSGRADFVAYDDAGFALASGTFAAGSEPVAEALALKDDLLTSHGMPSKEIRRDTDDPTVITRYRTHEISPLPAWAAANRHTGFIVTTKEVDDMLPDEKRAWLQELIGEDRVKAIEEELEAKGKSLTTEGVEFKESEADTAETAKNAEPGPTVEAAAVEATADYPTRDEVAAAVGDSLKPIHEAMAALNDSIAALGKELKEMRTAEDERLKDMVRQTPAASLFSLIQERAIGAKEAEIDGRSALAKDRPAAPKAGEDGTGRTFVPIIDEYIARSQAPR